MQKDFLSTSEILVFFKFSEVILGNGSTCTRNYRREWQTLLFELGFKNHCKNELYLLNWERIEQISQEITREKNIVLDSYKSSLCSKYAASSESERRKTVQLNNVINTNKNSYRKRCGCDCIFILQVLAY